MRFIIYIVLILLVYNIVKMYLYPGKVVLKKKNNESSADEEDMVLDPVCNTYFPRGSALRVRNGDDMHYFCSDECRQKYMKSH
ncbi:MAG: hypothetical protein A2073_06600 [Deltaproteobacteria bacterium GWC2_42_11]|nr:MAG: hypothetical protein A2073_06600 [Deltaproteobacteria bacterium GWC2_42_11]HBO83659.1 TRASH domain protein [Deltaproteobacteria bacterium]